MIIILTESSQQAWSDLIALSLPKRPVKAYGLCQFDKTVMNLRGDSLFENYSREGFFDCGFTPPKTVMLDDVQAVFLREMPTEDPKMSRVCNTLAQHGIKLITPRLMILLAEDPYNESVMFLKKAQQTWDMVLEGYVFKVLDRTQYHTLAIDDPLRRWYDSLQEIIPWQESLTQPILLEINPDDSLKSHDVDDFCQSLDLKLNESAFHEPTSQTSIQSNTSSRR